MVCSRETVPGIEAKLLGCHRSLHHSIAAPRRVFVRASFFSMAGMPGGIGRAGSVRTRQAHQASAKAGSSALLTRRKALWLDALMHGHLLAECRMPKGQGGRGDCSVHG